MGGRLPCSARRCPGRKPAAQPPCSRAPTTILNVPDVPAEYARAVFDAWVAGNQPRIEELAVPSVADLLAARPWSADDGWGDQATCEGAAGSTYCTWTGASAQLTIRVANEQGSGAEPHAATEAVFSPVPGRTIALWPVSTQEEADNSQQQVDEGHSPWQADPVAVATFYGGRGDQLGRRSGRAHDHWRLPDHQPRLGSPGRRDARPARPAGRGRHLGRRLPALRHRGLSHPLRFARAVAAIARGGQSDPAQPPASPVVGIA